MAPVDLWRGASRIPAAITVTHIFLVVYLSSIAARTIYRSKLALGPSASTRHRQHLRRGHVRTFAILAAVSLLGAFYFAVTFAGLSYRVWATERGIGLPESIFGDQGALRGGEHPGRIHIVRWLDDTTLYRDALEIVTEKARSFWWAQQSNLGLVSWSLFLAIEGQRRKIANLWVFLALSQLVNLSYAQNLFFVAVLLTPVPLPSNVKDITRSDMLVTSSKFTHLKEKLMPTKPEGFVPKTGLYTTLLIFNYLAIFLIPFASNTASFPTIALLSRSLPFTFLALPYIIPKSLGRINTSPHAFQAQYTKLFRTMSTISFLLHIKSTGLGLFYNYPNDHSYRHAVLHPFQNHHQSTTRKTSTAVGRLLGAITEHPAVSAVGWDVIISGLSLGVWAAVRGLDAREVIGSSIPFAGTVRKEVEEIKEATQSLVKSEPASPTIRRRPGRPRKAATPETDSSVSAAVPAPRRGRSLKMNESEAGYAPPNGGLLEEGDEEMEEDWEVAALTWGGIAVGGLGVGSSGVFGAEVRGR